MDTKVLLGLGAAAALLAFMIRPMLSRASKQQPASPNREHLSAEHSETGLLPPEPLIVEKTPKRRPEVIEASEPPGGWLTISATGYLTGPHASPEIAGRYRRGGSDKEKSSGTPVPNGFYPRVWRCIQNSAFAPFIIWEVVDGSYSVFLVVGPNGWECWCNEYDAALLLATAAAKRNRAKLSAATVQKIDKSDTPREPR